MQRFQKTPIQKQIEDTSLSFLLFLIDSNGGRPSLDDRALDVKEAIDRFVRDAFQPKTEGK
jgi:hypothetical protein